VLTQKTVGKVITCRAAVSWGPKMPLVIEEIKVDPPQAMEVRIKITHTSVCHTDILYWTGKEERLQAFPRILGHEGAGIVESVGEGVTDIKEGDHVIPLFTGECGDCVCCKSNRTNKCDKFKIDPMRTVMRIDGKTRFSIREKPIYHLMSTSTFSEYTVVDYACVVKINPEAPLDQACLLGCGITTGVGAALYMANIEPESTVAIFGLGTVGLAVSQGARMRGASRIIGVDTNPSKFIKARALGVTDCINPKDHEQPIHEVITEMTDGGVYYSFECIGNTEVLYEAFLATRESLGLTILLGLDMSPQKISFHPSELFKRRIVAATFGGVKGKSQLPYLVDTLIMNKEIRVDEFITQELPFSEINKAFELMWEGKSLRCILHL